MTSFMMISFFGLFMGFISLFMSLKHLLSMLISLEFMVLMVFLLVVLELLSDIMYVSLVYLIFSVCEGALGLTILVSMARGLGGDYFNTMSLNFN